MIATNHALTGALIGLTVHNPWVALPAAFVSHVLCDAIPHFAAANDKDWLSKPSFVRYLVADAFGCFLVVLVLFVARAPYWQLASICAFLATSPDFLWIREFMTRRAGRVFVRNTAEKFFGVVQWFQRPIGGLVEVAWFVGAVVLLWQFL